MNLQNNDKAISTGSPYKHYYKFIRILAIFLITIAIAEIFINKNNLYSIIAIMGYIFFIISVVPLFLAWDLAKNDEKILFFSSYITWMTIIPVLWIGTIYITLFLYSLMMKHCCVSNQLLQVDIWFSLTHIYGKLTPQLFTGLFVYISFWLSINIKKSKSLKVTAKGLSIMSFIFFLFVIIITFGA